LPLILSCKVSNSENHVCTSPGREGERESEKRRREKREEKRDLMKEA
jgi:hypothetical protein